MPLPPDEFLSESSTASLQDFRLARLNRAANLSKQIGKLIPEWIDEEASALIAEWVLLHREKAPEAQGRLPMPIGPKKARVPVWLRKVT